MSTKRGDPRGTRAYKARRLEVLQRDQWSCFYCMQPATTVDHVIPIIQGGDPIAYGFVRPLTAWHLEHDQLLLARFTFISL